jgi:hypothetical protein
VTSTKATSSASAIIEYHRCIAVTCTSCGQSFNDDFTHHFASLPHAVRTVAGEDWVLTATAALCGACVAELDHDQRPTPATPAVTRCEYCWPPLFSDTPSPEECCCAKLDAATTHVLVPFTTRTHPGFQQHACVTICCPQCQSGLRAEDDEMGEPHFDSPTAALHGAQKNYDWLVTGTVICCGSCARTRECAVLGHRLPEAPDRVTDDGIERRWCRHCTAVVMNPIADREMPWL